MMSDYYRRRNWRGDLRSSSEQRSMTQRRKEPHESFHSRYGSLQVEKRHLYRPKTNRVLTRNSWRCEPRSGRLWEVPQYQLECRTFPRPCRGSLGLEIGRTQGSFPERVGSVDQSATRCVRGTVPATCRRCMSSPRSSRMRKKVHV